MSPKKEEYQHRRISPAEWGGLAIGIVGAVASVLITYGIYVGTVSAQTKNIDRNTAAIEAVPDKITAEVQASEKRVMDKIKEVDKHNREDMKEMRGDIKQLLKQTK